MGYSIEWHDATIRFGPNHTQYGDPFDAAVQLRVDLYDRSLVHLFCVVGKMQPKDRDGICEFCAGLGYARMQETRKSKRKLETDLTVRPFKQRIVRDGSSTSRIHP